LVRLFFFITFLSLSLNASSLEKKMISYLGEAKYNKNAKFINALFKRKSSYMSNNRLDDMRILASLKKNGLLKLYFKKPLMLHLRFVAKRNKSIILMKIINQTLQGLGYYKYFISEVKQNKSKFSWEIVMKTEYNIDPILFRQDLIKRGCFVTKVTKHNKAAWDYHLNLNNAFVDAEVLNIKIEKIIKKPLKDVWFNIYKGKNATIYSNYGNRWYPNLGIYDKELNLLKLIKRDKKTKKADVKFPKNSKYLRVSDIYQISNLKNGFKIILKGKE